MQTKLGVTCRPSWEDRQCSCATQLTISYNDKYQQNEKECQSVWRVGSGRELVIRVRVPQGLAVVLAYMCSSCSVAPRYYNRPRIPIHKMQNLAIAFHFMRELEGIELVNIGGCGSHLAGCLSYIIS